MANYSTLKAAVADVVKTNGTQAITGANLQSTLLSIINSVGGGGYIFKGVATPSTDAGTPDENVFYIGGAGTYANFGTSVTVPVGSICVFKYNGSWTKEQIALFAGIDDVPTLNSNNLVRSGGVYNANSQLDNSIYENYALLVSYSYSRGEIFEALDGAIISSGIWTGIDRDDTKHIMLKINNGDTIVIKTGAIASYYGYLASCVKPKNNAAADFISGESRRTLSANASVTITATQDFFLYVTIKYMDVDYSPASIDINGHRVFRFPSNFIGGTSPNNYGIDSEEMDALVTTKKFFKTETVVNGFPVATIGLGNVGGDGRLLNKEEGYEHYIIKIMPNAVIKIKPLNTANADYAVLKYYDANYPSSAFCSTITGRQRIAAGSPEYTFTAPSDAYYLVVTKMYNGNKNYRPSYVKVNDLNAIDGTKSIEQRMSSLENDIQPFLRFTASQNKFEIFTKGKNGFVSYIITKEVDAQIAQNLWRVTDGYVYNRDGTAVARTLFNGENEFTARFDGFGAFENFTGGYHGGELLDGDETCFVNFYADGQLISDLSSDFEIQCAEFSYIQYTTLNKVYDGDGIPITGTPVFAHHLKSVCFVNGEMKCKNVVAFNDNTATLTTLFSGLVCVHKDVGANVIVPTGIKQACVGDNGAILSNDSLDAQIIFYNSQKSVLAKVSSRYVRGIDETNYLPLLTEYVWDRANDSKYYRRISDTIPCTASNKIETETIMNVIY